MIYIGQMNLSFSIRIFPFDTWFSNTTSIKCIATLTRALSSLIKRIILPAPAALGCNSCKHVYSHHIIYILITHSRDKYREFIWRTAQNKFPSGANSWIDPTRTLLDKRIGVISNRRSQSAWFIIAIETEFL